MTADAAVVDLLRIGDGACPHADPAAAAVEYFAFVVLQKDLEGVNLAVGPGEGIGLGIVAVVLQFALHRRLGLSPTAVELPHFQGLTVQILTEGRRNLTAPESSSAGNWNTPIRGDSRSVGN